MVQVLVDEMVQKLEVNVFQKVYKNGCLGLLFEGAYLA